MAEIAASPMLQTEARAALPMMVQIAAPCGDDHVRSALQPLVLVYGVGEAARTRAFWGVYFGALSDLPREALDAAVAEYPRQADAEFFPKPGKLRELGERHAEPILKALSRARRAVTMQGRRYAGGPAAQAPALRPIPLDERRAMSAAALQALRDSAPKPVARPVPPPLPAHGVDETGLSQPMRIAMGFEDLPEFSPLTHQREGAA